MSATNDIGSCSLDDDHPLWCVNAQITDLLEGGGASEDHLDVLQFLVSTGLPLGTAQRVHRAICCYERDTKPLGPVISDAAAKLARHRPAPPVRFDPVRISPAAAWPGVAKPQRFGSTLEERARRLYWDDTGPTGFVAQMISFYNLPPEQRDAWRAAAAERSL